MEIYDKASSHDSDTADMFSAMISNGYKNKYINNNKRKFNHDHLEYFNHEGNSHSLDASSRNKYNNKEDNKVDTPDHADFFPLISTSDEKISHATSKDCSENETLFESSSPSSVSCIDTNKQRKKKRELGIISSDKTTENTESKKDFETGSSYICSHRSTDQQQLCDRRYTSLPLEWWERSDDCLQAKRDHMDRLDHYGISRERLVYMTTLYDDDIVLEKNMFPYSTPAGIEHYTLWSVEDMSPKEIETFVDEWLAHTLPQVRRWQYDDNLGNNTYKCKSFNF